MGLVQVELGDGRPFDGQVRTGAGRFQPFGRSGQAPNSATQIEARVPVVYAHLLGGTQEVTFDLGVTMRAGRIHEHFPARELGEAEDPEIPPQALRWPAITARADEISATEYPRAGTDACATVDGFCEGAELRHYETEDGACVLHQGKPYDHLFYRGQASGELPYAVAREAREGDGWRFTGEPAGNILVIRRGDDGVSVRVVAGAGASHGGGRLEAPTGGPNAELGLRFLRSELAALGMTRDETEAFVRGWSRYLFDLGDEEAPVQTGPPDGWQTRKVTALLFFLPPPSRCRRSLPRRPSETEHAAGRSLGGVSAWAPSYPRRRRDNRVDGSLPFHPNIPMMFRIALPALALTLTLAGCTSDARVGGTPDAGTAACVPSTTDGRTACSSDFCPADEWCSEILCRAGCQSSANCASGLFCDKSGTTSVHESGVCRACPAPAPVDAGGLGCGDVSGNYSPTPVAANPSACSELSLGTCSVVQTGDALDITCFGDGTATDRCTLDGSTCTCTVMTTIEGVAATFVADFAADTIRVSGGGLLCEYRI